MKRILIIITLLLGLFIIPNVYAEELPREGVTYFMTYPNNEEVVTEDYDEAVSEPERLIYEGTTDSNGQIKVTGLGTQGEIKIVENGNTTKVNLSNQRSVEIQHKAIVNPKTGGTLVFIVVLVGGLVVVTIKTKKKKVLLVVPILLAVTLLLNVKAENEDFVVNVKDSSGKGIAGVSVKVYAKPISVEGLPAMKFDAKGGQFFDGKTVIYAKLPYDGCSWNEAWDYWYETDEEYSYYLEDNVWSSVREGYYPNYPNGPETLSNGATYNIEWEQDDEAKVITLHGNGNIYNFYGKKLGELQFYDGYGLPIGFENFGFSNEYIALSNNQSCNDAAYGLDIAYQLDVLDYDKDIYICTNDKADGIYLNDNFYIGNKDDCFMQDSERVYFNYNNYSYISLYDSTEEFTRFFDISNGRIRFTDPLSRIEIIYKGKTILSIGGNEMYCSGGKLTECYISNQTKDQILYEYINSIANKSSNNQCPRYCYYHQFEDICRK